MEKEWDHIIMITNTKIRDTTSRYLKTHPLRKFSNNAESFIMAVVAIVCYQICIALSSGVLIILIRSGSPVTINNRAQDTM